MKRLAHQLLERVLMAVNAIWNYLQTTRQISLSQQTQQLLAMQYKNNSAAPLPFSEVGFSCFSQFDEDGILHYIFSRIGTTNKVVVEMCAGNGLECNAANLIINHGWIGYLFDGDQHNVAIGRRFFARHRLTRQWPPAFNQAWINAENVNGLLQEAQVPAGEIDLLSLDIDGMDYWVFKAIEWIRPRVIVAETLSCAGPDRSITCPYDPNFVCSVPDYQGASLLAMTRLAQQKGYRLVGTHQYGFNAFFVRNDIGTAILPEVKVADCFSHPYAQDAIRNRWPKVKDQRWQEV